MKYPLQAQNRTGDWMFISFLRTIVLYLVIVLTLRVLGKRQVGELEPSELVVAILISDLAAVPMQDIGIPLLSGVIPIITLLALELLASEWSMHSVKFRAFLCGKPVFIIWEGVIDQSAMRKNRLTMDELNFCLRQAGILELEQVQYAVLAAQDAGKSTKRQEFPVNVICNGEIMEENLRFLERDRVWVDGALAKENTSLPEVFLMTGTREGTVQIIKRRETL